MSLSQATSLADEPGKMTPEDHNIATTSEKSIEDVSNSEPRQATLLGIPKELRNKIFEYVYATPNMTGDHVSLDVRDPYVSPRFLAEAFIPLSQTTPSKAQILVCRQLYSEMGKMQARAFREYWSKSVFEAAVSFRESYYADAFYTVTDSDLKHVEHFILFADCQDNMIKVEGHYQDQNWIAFLNASDDAYKAFHARKNFAFFPGPQRLQRLVNFEREVRMDSRHTLPCETSQLDPTIGSGFDSMGLDTAISVVERLIMDGSYRGWAAL